MSDEYTPTTGMMRSDYVTLHTRNFDAYQVGRSLTSEQERYGERFDHWLAEVKAEAWDEGYWQGINGHTGPGNPYRDSGVREEQDNE